MEGEPVAGWKRKGHNPYHCATCVRETDTDILESNRRARLREAQMLAAEHDEAGNVERANERQRRADDERE